MRTSFTGKRDKRGDWRPPVPLHLAPLFDWPSRPMAILKWLFGYPGYFLPWGILYMAVPVVTWLWFTPDLADMKTFQLGWVAYVLARNYVLVALVYGGWHLRLYVRKAQGADYKYSNKWLARDNPIFLFKNQVLDNLFWALVSGVPMWTAYEVVTLWGYANHFWPYVDWSAHPLYCVLLMCVIPMIRDVHFFAIHRLIHWGPLYRWIHSVHHNSVNPSPWSSLSSTRTPMVCCLPTMP